LCYKAIRETETKENGGPAYSCQASTTGAFWTKAPPDDPIIAKMTCALNADAGKAVRKPPDANGGANVRSGM